MNANLISSFYLYLDLGTCRFGFGFGGTGKKSNNKQVSFENNISIIYISKRKWCKVKLLGKAILLIQTLQTFK